MRLRAGRYGWIDRKTSKMIKIICYPLCQFLYYPNIAPPLWLYIRGGGHPLHGTAHVQQSTPWKSSIELKSGGPRARPCRTIVERLEGRGGGGQGGGQRGGRGGRRGSHVAHVQGTGGGGPPPLYGGVYTQTPFHHPNSKKSCTEDFVADSARNASNAPELSQSTLTEQPEEVLCSAPGENVGTVITTNCCMSVICVHCKSFTFLSSEGGQSGGSSESTCRFAYVKCNHVACGHELHVDRFASTSAMLNH